MSGLISLRRVRSAAGGLTSLTRGGQGFIILDGLPAAQWAHRNIKSCEDTHNETGAHVYLKLATWNLLCR